MSPLYHAVMLALLLLASYVTISRRVDEVLGAVWSMVGWFVWAFYAYDINRFSNGTEFVEEYRGLAFLGIASGIIMLLFLVRAVTGTLQTSEQTRFGADDLTRGEP